MRIQRAQQPGQTAGRLLRALLRLPLPPESGERAAQLGHELRRHLSHRLGLATEFGQVVAVAHPAAPEALARMADLLAAATEGQLVHPDPGGDPQPGPVAGHRVPGAADLGHRAAPDRDRGQPARVEGHVW